MKARQNIAVKVQGGLRRELSDEPRVTLQQCGLPAAFGSTKSQHGKRKGKKRQRPPHNEDSGFAISRYWYKRYQLWSKYDRGILMDDEGWYSVTPEAVAKQVAQRLKGAVLLDCFCGYGGNIIQFALEQPGSVVIGCDIVSDHVQMARHNARIYGVQDRIELVCCDAFHMLSALKGLGRVVDAIFLSPPWGGPEYIRSEVFDLGSMPVAGGTAGLLAAAAVVCPEIAIYLPRNCNHDHIRALLQPCHSHVTIETVSDNGKVVAIMAYFTAKREAVASHLKFDE